MSQQNFFNGIPLVPVIYKTEDGGTITSGELQAADKETQKKVMRIWFHERFEDPAQRCPYSSEDGYVFLYGGPFYASEEIENEFAGIASDESIEEAVGELNRQGWQWETNRLFSTDDDWDYIPSDELPEHLQIFRDKLSNINALLGLDVGDATEQHFLGMLYVSVITALEAYLLDNFISCLDANEATFRKFIETTEEFKKWKIPLSSILSTMEGLKQLGRGFLVDRAWHRLDGAADLYEKTLGVKFPQDMSALQAAVKIRHGLVHGNRKHVEGKGVDLTKDEIKELVGKVENFVKGIEDQLDALKEVAPAKPEEKKE